MINFNKLPDSVKNTINFNELFSMKPDDRSKIILYDKDNKEFRPREIFRSYMSYLETPEFNIDVKKSYMFVNKNKEFPKCLSTLLDYVKTIDARYNQMVINWYNPEDYIELHRDCTSSFIDKDCPILMVNLNETSNIYNIRSFNMVAVDTSEMVSVPLLDGYMYTITNNNTHKHYTGKGVEKRISITFRMMKEPK